MTDMDMAGLDIVLVLLFAVLCAAIILTTGNKRQRHRFPSLIKLFQFWIVV